MRFSNRKIISIEHFTLRAIKIQKIEKEDFNMAVDSI